MDNNRVMKEFLRTAVKIEAYNEEELMTHTGSGFFYKIKLGKGIDYGKHVHICLVSNKHVLEDVSTVVLTENQSAFGLNDSLEAQSYRINDVKKRVIFHEEQDLAVINISDLIMKWIGHETNHTFKFIDNDLIAHENELDMLNTNFFMVGYPLGIESEVSYKGFIYRGHLAYPPDMAHSYQDSYIFNLDGYHGNSGSPVFALIHTPIKGTEIKLIGIQYQIYFPQDKYIRLTEAVKVKYLQELEPKIDKQWKDNFYDKDNIMRHIEQFFS